MSLKEYPTQEKLKELFDYRKDGELIWKLAPSSRANIGDVAGTINKKNGYRYISFCYEQYLAHRLVFILHHGYNPENDIDHFPDRNKLNNRIANLREATRSCNMINTPNRENNTSGVKGVVWIKGRDEWRAQLMIMGKSLYLSQCKEFSEAVLHRLACEQCLGWEGCDSSSPAYMYAINHKLISR